ncbi:polycystic kidney disease protein 1-like 2 isoform X2 [Branchiostoma floridae]|uniref:Polycystic kidney disease protein 1-like 2 isoform X2 n=1 Tax=Branchiostoma floridae TaxID=7739 RepID=A0A9J7KY36_BRAFL|nr:polycystic kidney disease protein 1-like 2 isoform X2 [Branchiostoma floridae]
MPVVALLAVSIQSQLQVPLCYDAPDKSCTCHTGTNTGVPCTTCVCEHQLLQLQTLCAGFTCPAALTQASCVDDGTAVVSACTIHAVLFEGPRPRADRLVFQRKYGFKFTSDVAAECTNGDPTIARQWTLYRLDETQTPAALTVESVLVPSTATEFVIPGNAVPTGEYLLQLEMTVTETSGVKHTYVEQTWLEVVQQALVAYISGGSRQVVPADDYTMVAGNSWDPELIVNSASFTYTWTYEILQESTNDPCTGYLSLTDSWRDWNNGLGQQCDGLTFTPGWYRVEGAAGNSLLDQDPLSMGKCSTTLGWYMVEPPPVLSQGDVCRKMCGYFNGDPCFLSIDVMAKACPGNYYVYFLPYGRFCDTAYCTITKGVIDVSGTTSETEAPEDHVCHHFESADSARRLFGLEGTIIQHTVQVSYPGRLPGTYITITELGPPGSSLFITCWTNCNPVRNLAWEQTVLEAETTMTGSIVWTVPVLPAGAPAIDWATQTAAGTDTGPVLRVLPDTFVVAGDYTFRATLFVGGVATAYYAEYSSSVVVKPNDGSITCQIEPNDLIPLTPACITCSAFPYDFHPVNYEFQWWKAGGAVAAVAFPRTPAVALPAFVSPYSGLAHYSLNTLLPPGRINFRVRITSVDGIDYNKDFDIVVIPRNTPASVWAPPLLNGPDSAFRRKLNRGDRAGAAQLAGAIAGVGTELAKSDPDAATELIGTVLDHLDEIDTSNDLAAQKAVLSALAVAAGDPDLLTPAAAVGAASKTLSVLRDLKDQVAAGLTTVADVNVACAAAFVASGGALKAAARAAAEDHSLGLVYSEKLQANKDVAESAFRTIDVMDDIYLNYMMTAPDITGPPWPPAMISISQLELRIQREECGDSSNSAFRAGDDTPVIFGAPSVADLMDGCSGNSNVTGVSIIHAGFNPFEYSNNSQLVEGEVIGLNSKRGEATNHVAGLGTPIDMIIRRRDNFTGDIMLGWNIGSAYVGNVTVVPFLVRYSGSSLHINIRHNYTDPPPVVHLFLRKEDPPTPEVYNWTVTLPTPQADLFTIPAGNDTVTASPYSWLVEPPEIDITEDDVVNKTLFFLGIQFEDGEDAATHLNFSVDVMETLCVYFGDEWGNQEDHLWHDDGCRPGPLSNSTHMHCRCDHLTKFTGVVAPNPINFAEVFTKDILQNPIGLILVLVVFLLYLLAVLWARKADRRDLTKVGVAPPQGHILNPDPWCQYVVTLYTGFKGGAGTTASVWINLFGDYGRTGPIALQDENRPLFEEGSVDSFLVSSRNIIGMIHVIHVWHDNTGYSPEWYLSQIVVQEKATDRIVYFMCNRWFAVGEDDGKIERLIPVASPEEMTEFVNLFRSKTSRDVNDSHLWFSVKGRPARSPFTRVQRLSCCLTLLYSTMVTNIMFFGQGDNFDPPEKIQIAGVEMDPPIDLPKLMISLQSAAIIMPVNLLIVFFFRNARRKPKAKDRKINKRNSEEEHAAMPDRSESWMLAALAEPVDKKKTVDNQNQLLSTSPSVQTASQEPILMYSLGLERTFAFNSKSVMANKSQSSPKKSKDKKSKKSKDEDESSLKSLEAHKEQHNAHPKEEEGGVRWWSVCIGWLLVWSASFVAAFFTVLYTLSFGRPKAEAWCIAFVTSFLSDLIVVQPVKLVVVAVVFALFLKSPVTEENPEPVPLCKDEEYLPSKRDRLPVVTRPPDKAELSEARLKKLEDKKRRSAIIEVWLFVIFVLVVTMIAYNEKDPMAFHMNESVKNSLLYETEELTFEEVADVESFWTWLQAGLIPTLYHNAWYNGRVNPAPVIMGNGKSWLVGAAAIRQVRLEPELPCEVPEQMQTYGKRCVLSFSLTDMDTANYSTGWQNSSISNNTDSEEMLKPWVYTFASLTDGFPTFGEHGSYIGGGYSTSLDPSVLFSNQTREELLQDGGWLDENTRAVMVEVLMYNPDANLFSVVTFLVEFTYYGNAYPSVVISTLRLFQTSQILLLALKGVMVLFLFIFLFREGKQLMASPVEYLLEVWNWVELLVILAGFSTLGVYFQTQSVIDQVSEPGGHTQFSVYRRATGWVEVYTYVTAGLICCVTLKLVRLLRFNKVVQVLFGTISTAFKPLAGFMMVVAVIMLAYTQLGSLLFGSNLETYSSIGSSLASICLMTIGSFDTAELTEVSWIYGPIFFFLLQVTMQFFLLTMFMAILMDTYADANQNTEAQKLRMMAFMRKRVTGGKKMQQTSKNTRNCGDRSGRYQVSLWGDPGVYRETFNHADNALEYPSRESFFRNNLS